MKMMNDIAIDNVTRILQNEITSGRAVIGIISVDEGGHIHLCWRTDNEAQAQMFEDGLKHSMQGQIDRDIVSLPKEA